MDTVNIEQIMQEIRQEIKEKGYKESDLSFRDIAVKNVEEVQQEEFDLVCLENRLHHANTHIKVDYYKPITDGGLKGMVKKAIRKLLRSLVFPICQEQEIYNAAMVQSVNQMKLYMQIQEKRIDELEKIISEGEL